MTADTGWKEDQQLVRNLLNAPCLPPIPGPVCPHTCSAGWVSAPHLPARQMRTQIPQLHRRRALNWNQMGSGGQRRRGQGPAPASHCSRARRGSAPHIPAVPGTGTRTLPARSFHTLPAQELPHGRKKTERCFPR